MVYLLVFVHEELEQVFAGRLLPTPPRERGSVTVPLCYLIPIR